MLVVALRTIITYSIIILSMRLMGKKQLGELQPSELVSTILISNLASISIEQPEIPLLSSIVPVMLIVCIEIFLSILCLKSHTFSKILTGSPKILIRNGVLDKNALNELRFTIDDLLEAMRAKDVFSIKDISLGLIETNGTLSIFKTDETTEVCKGDLLCTKKNADIPFLPVITNGDVNYNLLSTCKLTKEWLQQKLNENHICSCDVLLMLCNSDEECEIIKKDV